MQRCKVIPKREGDLPSWRDSTALCHNNYHVSNIRLVILTRKQETHLEAVIYHVWIKLDSMTDEARQVRPS